MSNKKSTPALDEKIKLILEALPGVDCGGHGGCGFLTCQACAEAIVKDEAVALCPACTQETVDEIAKILGVPTVEVKDEVVFVRCTGNAAGKERLAGCKSCLDAVNMGYIDGECQKGCVGIGSCIDFCKFDAMSLVDGQVVIDKEKCTGCMACLDSCPRLLLTKAPREATNFIPCASNMEEEKAKAVCTHGCLGCGDCEKACPQGAITMVDNCAVIDYSKCVGCVTCTVTCKRKIIVDDYHDLRLVKPEVAFVKCKGGAKASEKFKSIGIETCKDAHDNWDSSKLGLCSQGCRGLGDCVKVCRYDAINVDNGVAHVDPEKCVGCKECSFHCPQLIIEIVPYKGSKHVACSSTASVEEKMKVCNVGCIACGDCVANCPNDAMHLVNGHAEVDSEKCLNCGVCSYMCSRGVMEEQEVPEYNYLQQDALVYREGE